MATFPIQLLREFWFPGLQNIAGLQERGFKAWISSGNYLINSNPLSNQIELFVRDDFALRIGFAADISRLASAAFESAFSISKITKFPKSTAWALIKIYYAAFFSAHSILRILGVTCSQLEKGHLNILKSFAEISGFSWPVGLKKGFFICGFDYDSNLLTCKKARDTHADTWATFYLTLNNLSKNVLTVTGISAQKQTVSKYLTDICDAIVSGKDSPKGNWLSQFRNRINYRQDYGAWYPYKNIQAKFENVEPIINEWKSDPSRIVIGISRGKEIKRFTETCVAIIALCRCLINDMETVCSTNKFFQKYGALAFLRTGKI